jgi:hypothetical protein
VHIREIRKAKKFHPEDTNRIDQLVDPGAVKRILITGVSKNWV